MNEDDKLDEIFNKVDDLFLAGKFEEADALLSAVDPREIGETLTIGWLTITFAARDRLQNRDALVARARAYFEAEIPEAAAALLKGLE
ncbi:MAG: hypothetical protein E4H01_09535 [Lysobacterales bacterium]|nr:MAG: hypothetical protein E4H01_09535 [Xanthomonadales bacterium]